MFEGGEGFGVGVEGAGVGHFRGWKFGGCIGGGIGVLKGCCFLGIKW